MKMELELIDCDEWNEMMDGVMDCCECVETSWRWEGKVICVIFMRENYCVVMIVLNIKSNQESNTFFHISSNEGRECQSSTIHAWARLKYDCGQLDSIPGRTPSEVIKWNNSPMLETLISE